MTIGPIRNTGTNTAGLDAVKFDAQTTTNKSQPKGDGSVEIDGNTQKSQDVDTTDKPSGRAGFGNPGDTTKRISAISAFDVVAVMFQAAQQQRELATQDRQSALEANVTNLLASADKLKDAAKDRKTAAITSAAVSMVGSVISLSANAAAMRMSFQTVEVKPDKVDMFDAIGAQTTKVAKYSETVIKAVSGAGDAVSGLVQSGGKVAAAGYEFSADMLSANSKKDEAMASMQEKRYQEANDFRENAKQAQNAVMDYIRAVAQSEVETSKSIARNL